MSGKARSLSVKASGQVGSDTQAPAQRRTWRDLADQAKTAAAEMVFDVQPVVPIDIAQEQALAGRQADGRAVAFADLAQGRFQPHLARVLDAPAGHVQAVEPAAVALLAPAEVVVDVPDLVGLRRRQLIAQVLLDLLLETLQAPIGDEVLQPRPLAIAAIAEVAKDAKIARSRSRTRSARA